MIAQLAAAMFGGDNSIGFFYIQAATALILVLAANTAFNGFPLLGSVLAQDRFLPRQLHTRGDRLAFSNGILLLAGFAGLLIVAFHADVTRLIQLYIIGVFTCFTLGQSGMVRHWNRDLRTERDPQVRRRMRRSRAINAVGGALTSVVLVIIVLTKFTHGAWLVLVAMPLLFVLMKAISRHYTHVAEQLVPDTDARMLPRKVHAIVLVSKVHKPTLRALAYARATRPDHLTALTVNVDDDETRGAAGRVGALRPAGAADRRSSRRTGRSPGRSSITSRTSAGRARGRSSSSSSPSTSSGTGGRTCCTTRARCGCAPGCCSSPGSW